MIAVFLSILTLMKFHLVHFESFFNPRNTSGEVALGGGCPPVLFNLLLLPRRFYLPERTGIFFLCLRKDGKKRLEVFTGKKYWNERLEFFFSIYPKTGKKMTSAVREDNASRHHWDTNWGLPLNPFFSIILPWCWKVFRGSPSNPSSVSYCRDVGRFSGVSSIGHPRLLRDASL